MSNKIIMNKVVGIYKKIEDILLIDILLKMEKALKKKK